MSTAISRVPYLEPLGFDIPMLREMMQTQLKRKLSIVGMSLPADMAEQLTALEPVIAGG
jgi:hypothetical protein